VEEEFENSKYWGMSVFPVRYRQNSEVREFKASFNELDEVEREQWFEHNYHEACNSALLEGEYVRAREVIILLLKACIILEGTAPLIESSSPGPTNSASSSSPAGSSPQSGSRRSGSSSTTSSTPAGSTAPSGPRSQRLAAGASSPNAKSSDRLPLYPNPITAGKSSRDNQSSELT
jgi:hypothetical protein